MARSGHSTQLTFTSGRHRACQPQTQKLMDNEISELKNYLPEWTLAKRNEKRAVFTAIARAARLFAPKVDQAQWKKRKQMYKTWLFNNQKKKERKDMIKYGSKWTPRQVIYQQKWEEVLKRIEDESGAKPGGPSSCKRVMAELSDDELEKAKDTAEEWSNNFPPPEIQAQVARKKGWAYMEHFSKEMWRQCGMRVFVMSAWKNEQGEVLFGMHDDNEALGDGESAGAQDVLPDITETKLEEKKAIVRAFLTSHYYESIIATPRTFVECIYTGICSGIDKAVVPWSAIIQSQDDFVARKYVLVDVDLKEPSKLQHWDTTALLNFWYARQEKGEGPTFLFKAWKNRDGDMVASVVSRDSPSHRTRKVRQVMIRRPQNSATETDSDPETDHESDPESNPEGNTHQMEDDADDDALEAHEGTAGPTCNSKASPGQCREDWCTADITNGRPPDWTD
ncbi:hypothetical protein DFJ58DRAFT_842234 [Suillus subalutaceus]|uniref:uncharacterized protein n=1 Tax=Suillus subalutaceus TaxID=48586 RepID=UPI001B86A5D7|nr:uncharacterized protein DFJ58DRAFT_842234 [Suillus subalutaceus]KAG1851352.1 hypothetical protein DFJ58DRAFT_842234 [Suillus subalutaceus]